jgi:hypothetical protein
LDERLKAKDAAAPFSGLDGGYAIDSEMFKLVCDDVAQEAGVSLLFHTLSVDTIVEDKTVRGVIIENKSGRQGVLAKVVVDATGDGDVAARAGAPFKIGREKDGLMEPVSLLFRMSNVNKKDFEAYCGSRPWSKVMHEFLVEAVGKEGWSFNIDNGGPSRINEAGEATGINITRIGGIDPTNAEDMSRAELEGRRQVLDAVQFFRRYVPGFEWAELSVIGCQTGPRESRRISGEYEISRADIDGQRTFNDAVGRFCDFVDRHDPVDPIIHIKTPTSGSYFQIPYRALVPRKTEGLLIAGRCISASHEAVGATRQVYCCMATGQAAGTAAALAGDQGVSPRFVDIRCIQSSLREQGVTI